MKTLFSGPSVADIEERLKVIERLIGDLRAEQAVLVNELDKVHAHRADASRTLGEWLQSRLDVSKQTARALVTAGRGCVQNQGVQRDLANSVTFDRAVATHRLIETGVDEGEARRTIDQNLEDIRKLTVRRKRLNRVDEQTAFKQRYFGLQPTLDESAWTVSGRLPGLMGRTVEKAIAQRADELRQLPGGDGMTRAQRQADALVAILQDCLDVEGDQDVKVGRSAVATVFVDARGDRATSTDNGDRAHGDGAPVATVPFGPRVGPEALAAMLCGARIRLVGLDGDEPSVWSDATHAIRPAVRDAVLFRDDGCVIDGCQSRYRLEPHHILERSRNGGNEPENLATLCWFHHHVAIHGEGFVLDPESPPKRRKLIRSPDDP